jgi:hypothetical protein
LAFINDLLKCIKYIPFCWWHSRLSCCKICRRLSATAAGFTEFRKMGERLENGI